MYIERGGSPVSAGSVPFQGTESEVARPARVPPIPPALSQPNRAPFPPHRAGEGVLAAAPLLRAGRGSASPSPRGSPVAAWGRLPQPPRPPLLSAPPPASSSAAAVLCLWESSAAGGAGAEPSPSPSSAGRPGPRLAARGTHSHPPGTSQLPPPSPGGFESRAGPGSGGPRCLSLPRQGAGRSHSARQAAAGPARLGSPRLRA